MLKISSVFASCDLCHRRLPVMLDGDLHACPECFTRTLREIDTLAQAVPADTAPDAVLPFYVDDHGRVFHVGLSCYHTRFLVYMTDPQGNRLYIRSVYRSRYEWTRSDLYAKAMTKETAVRHLAVVAEILRRENSK